MDTQDKVDKDFKKAFNRGYEIAKELGLKSPMFKNQNENNSPTNAIQAGMMQFIDESVLLTNKNIGKSVNQRKMKSNQKTIYKSKNTGKGLIP